MLIPSLVIFLYQRVKYESWVINIDFCHTRAPSWNLSKAEYLESYSLQDGATKWLYNAAEPNTHPPNHRISWKYILDSQESRKYGSFYVVRCPHPIDKVCALSPPHPACIWFSHNPIVTSSKKHVPCPPPTTGILFRKYVPCPPLSVNTFSVRCLPPKFISLPWTLWLCLGFWAKLRIWLVHDCKMKPSSTCILECGTPSWACFFYCLSPCFNFWNAFINQFLNVQPRKHRFVGLSVRPGNNSCLSRSPSQILKTFCPIMSKISQNWSKIYQNWSKNVQNHPNLVYKL